MTGKDDLRVMVMNSDETVCCIHCPISGNGMADEEERKDDGEEGSEDEDGGKD